MHLSTVLLPFLASYALAADYNTVVADIAAIKNATTNLDSAVKMVTPGLLGLPATLQVQVDAVQLDKQIVQGTDDANASPAFGSAGSLSVSTALLDLQGTVKTALQDTAAKNTSFGDFGPVVLASLYQLKQDTDAFGTAVVAKLDPLEQGLAPGVTTAIDGYFNDAIAAYGGQTS